MGRDVGDKKERAGIRTGYSLGAGGKPGPSRFM